jgi:thioredoxin reductase (NADPH)
MLPLLLAVGNDARMAKALQRQLHRGFASRGFRTAGFDSAPPALEILRDLKDREEPVALVVADQEAPEMTGLGLLREGRKLHPDVRTVLLCEHADLQLAADAVNTAALDHFLVKPFDGEQDLLPILADLLDGWLGSRERDAAGVRIVGERDSARGHEIRQFLGRNNIHYQWLEPGSGDGRTLLENVAEPERAHLPVAVFGDGVAVADPTNVQLASQLGIPTRPTHDHYDLVIVGGGPAGLAAAVYGSSEGLSTVMIERVAPGGQAGQSPRIDNYLGFHAGLSGSELTRRAIIQARRFGAEIVRPRDVIGIEWQDDDRILRLSDRTTLSARSVLIATGVSYRRLTAPGVPELLGAGVYYGASPRDAQDRVDQHVFIVGGANSAGQSALNFARYARKVTILVRADSLAKGMSQYLVDQIEAAGNIEVLTRTELAAAHGSDRLESLILKRDGDGTTEPVPADAVFIFIGAQPRTEWLQGKLIADERGFLVSGRDLGGRPADWPLDRDPYVLESCMPGVFVAGDVRHGSIKRVASAVGEGSMAVQLIHQYLAERD